MQWTSVKEKFPEAFIWVLATEGLNVWMCRYENNTNWMIPWDMKKPVTHWMPLPELPKT